MTFEETDLGAANVVAVLEGTDPALRGEYVALGAHNDAIGIVRAVDHDSLRAYNTVMRPRGANDSPGEPNAEQASRIKSIVDSMRKLRPARLDSIVNGADDDGSGSMALLEIAEAATKRAPAQAIAAVRLAYRGGVGAAGLALVHRQPDGAARLHRRPAQHRHDGPGRPEGRDHAGSGVHAADRLAPALHRAGRPGRER